LPRVTIRSEPEVAVLPWHTAAERKHSKKITTAARFLAARVATAIHEVSQITNRFAPL
jgi:hypothetical protein